MNSVILALLIVNVLFWSFFPHSAHCYLLNGINNTFTNGYNRLPISIILFSNELH